jgi:hypothetical protein
VPGLNDHASAIDVRTQFRRRYGVLEGSVLLFAADAQGVVAHRAIGRNETARLVLSRSAEMEALVRTEVAKLVDDWRSGSSRYGGLIYCMGWREPNLFMPL